MYRRENGLKNAEFGYPVTKFISSAAQSSRDRLVEPRSQAMTVRAPNMERGKRMLTGCVPDNKRSINGYHRTSNGLVPDKTEVQRMRTGQNVLPT